MANPFYSIYVGATNMNVPSSGIDTRISQVPLSIREALSEVPYSDTSIDTADGNLKAPIITLKGKVWHSSSPKIAWETIYTLRAAMFGITPGVNLQINWAVAIGGGTKKIADLSHCVKFDFDIAPGKAMKELHFTVAFRVLTPEISPS